jgi:hypothetical protein
MPKELGGAKSFQFSLGVTSVPPEPNESWLGSGHKDARVSQVIGGGFNQ